MPLPPDLSLVVTDDESPSLAFRRADGYVERMHHQAGALTESRFIYEAALEDASAVDADHTVLSIGLGLGYNEMITIARLEREGRRARIFSAEAMPFLREGFLAWARGETAELAATYDDVAARVGTSRAAVGRWIDEGHLQLREDFPRDVGDLRDVGLVYFDAYSNKMDPHLWDEETLVDVFAKILAPTCVLATYAATGALNRVLRRLHLVNRDKTGFRGKRQSTLGIRLALNQIV